VEAQWFLADRQQVELSGRELIERMASGDHAALEEFYDQYNKLVYSLVLRVLGCQAEAEDVTLDVFWQAWQQASQYSQSRGSISAWLIMMARSRAIDRRRSSERRNGYSTETVEFETENREDSSILDPEKSLYLIERREAVRNALSEIGEKQRQALELAYFNGLSQSEIAALLQEPLGTVKTRIRAAMQILREKLKNFI